jgi:hypothetical protein
MLALVRLAFTSDLHVEQNPEVAALVAAAARRHGADVLVIAGDLAGGPGARAPALAALAGGAPRVVFVPGNHDLWARRGGDSRALYLDAIPAECARAGVTYLPAGPVDCGGVTLVGQTGWYDYSLADPALPVPVAAYENGVYGKLAWSDHHFVKWPGLARPDGHVDDRALAAWMIERLAADLAAAPRDRPAVVVTHMLPWGALAARRPLPWGFVRGFLGAAGLGEAIVGAARAGLPVAATICGHTHFARRVRVTAPGGRAFVAAVSPVGYPREHRRMGFPDLAAVVARRVRVVDVDVPALARLRAA